MTLALWNPLRDIDDLFSRLNRGYLRSADGVLQANWAPAVDISESDKEYLIEAEVPGIKKQGFKVTVENGLLTLSGERKSEMEVKEQKRHRIERFHGSFERSFSLPENAVVENIAADYSEGMVRIHIPKAEVKKPSKVEIAIQ